MTLYQACSVLNIWPTAKIWAEVWYKSDIINEKSVNNVVLSAKESFKRLAKLHHPDKGGVHEEYVIIQNAFDVIKNASISDFILSLREEHTVSDYYESGSLQCLDCTKWSTIAGTCTFSTCQGFKSYNNQQCVFGVNERVAC